MRRAAQILRLWTVIVGILVAEKGWAVNLTCSGTLPRTIGTSFSVNVNVTGLTTTQINGVYPTAPYTDNLQLYLPQSVGSTNTYAAANAGAATAAMPYYVTIIQTSPQAGQPETGGLLVDYDYQVTFYYVSSVDPGGANSPTSLAAKGPGNVTIAAGFLLGTNNALLSPTTATPCTITQSNYVATAVPPFSPTAPVVGSMQQLTVSWTPQTSIPVTGSTGTAAPNNVYVYVLDGENFGSQALPAYEYNPSATAGQTSADFPSTCTYTQPTTPASMCVACTSNDTTAGRSNQYYLSESQINGQSGVIAVQTVLDSAGSTTITGLTNGYPYVVFLQYDTPGLTPSTGQQCFIGIPSANYTLTELNGDPTGHTVAFRCFIATAAYGTPLHKDMRFFRKFRDNILLQHPWGKRFVHYYYKWSPPLADYIAAHPWLRRVTRWVLAVPAKILEVSDDWY